MWQKPFNYNYLLLLKCLLYCIHNYTETFDLNFCQQISAFEVENLKP